MINVNNDAKQKQKKGVWGVNYWLSSFLIKWQGEDKCGAHHDKLVELKSMNSVLTEVVSAANNFFFMGILERSICFGGWKTEIKSN